MKELFELKIIFPFYQHSNQLELSPVYPVPRGGGPSLKGCLGTCVFYDGLFIIIPVVLLLVLLLDDGP